MLLKNKSFYLYEVVALIASVLLALFAYLQPGDALEPGLDSSWNYGLNYVIQHKLVMGKDIYFTFGPLGFLEHTAPLTLSMLDISSQFWFACSVISFFLVLVLCRESALTKWHVIINIALAMVLIFFANAHIQRLLIITYACAFLHWRTHKDFYLLLMAISAVISLMIKFSYGAVALALYLPYLASITWRDKNFVRAIAGIIALPFFYLLLWFVIYGALSGSIGYIKGGLEFSRGSTSAMALNPDNNWFAISGFFVAFICGIMIATHNKRPAWILMPLCFLGPLFIWSKYAFGREDSGHLAYLMSFVFYLGLLWVISAEKLLHKIASLIAIYACFFTWQQASVSATATAEFTPRHVFFKPRTFKYRWNREELFKIMQENVAVALTPLQLDSETLDTIGKSTVDVYPWETLIAEANKLNWVPRPVFQSYLTYTPFLDRKNSAFYESARAPEFIIWHYHSFQDIDNRYSFSSNPLTLQAILQHYTPMQCKGSFCLWRHTQHNQLSVTPPESTKNSSWNTWINLPASNASIIRAHLNTRHTVLGKLNLAFWKEGGVEIDYLLDNNEIKTHTLAIDNAISGLWASPYMIDRPSGREPKPISQQRLKKLLSKKPAEGYLEKAESIAGSLYITGWGFLPFKATQSQQLNILLYNDKQAYLVKAENRARPGITEYFGKTGIVNLETSGIDEVINGKNMVPGQYQLAFEIKNKGESAAHAQMPPLFLNVQKYTSENRHNVKAIRIRTSRPWAFTDTIVASWSESTFTENPLW